jgi:type I site-specific restriction endonuclease
VEKITLHDAMFPLVVRTVQVHRASQSPKPLSDYVLKDSRSRPLAVIEAKRFSVDPHAAMD